MTPIDTYQTEFNLLLSLLTWNKKQGDVHCPAAQQTQYSKLEMLHVHCRWAAMASWWALYNKNPEQAPAATQCEMQQLQQTKLHTSIATGGK
jgi:hypothetical protein